MGQVKKNSSLLCSSLKFATYYGRRMSMYETSAHEQAQQKLHFFHQKEKNA